jgi:hypothetical protein
VTGLLLIVGLLLVTPASSHYQLWTVWQKTVSGVYMRARLSLNDYSSTNFSGAASSASFNASSGTPRAMETLYARSRGQWRCDFTTHTRWDAERWEYRKSLAAAGGSGTYSWQCGWSSIIASEGWYKFRNWTWTPYISEDAHGWECEVEFGQGVC